MKKLGKVACYAAAVLTASVASAWAVPPNNTAFVEPNGGFDSGTCGAVTAQCQTLNGALAVIGSGGVIYIQAGASFGPVYLTVPVSIIGPADQSVQITFTAATLPGCVGGAPGSCNGSANATVALEINAGTSDTVKLKNVTVNNGAGTNGAIKIDSAFNVSMTHTIVRGGSGSIAQMMLVAPATNTQFQLYLNQCDIAFSGTGGGIVIAPTGTTPVRAHFNNSELHNAVFGLQVNATGLSGSADIAIAIDNTEFFSFNNSSVAVTATGSNQARASLARSTVLNTGGAALKFTGANAFGALYENVITSNATGVNVVGGASVATFQNNQIFGNGINCAVGGASTACTTALSTQAQN
jgi:hypothetical protein